MAAGLVALSLAGVGAVTHVWAETAPEPPLWAYLAECSAVFEATAGSAENYDLAGPPEITRAAEVARLFLAEAVEEAEDAGQTDPEGDVTSIMGYLRERWRSRTTNVFSVPSNFTWVAYCGRLARQRGILPLGD